MYNNIIMNKENQCNFDSIPKCNLVCKPFLEGENILSNNKPEIIYCEQLGVAMCA